MTIAVMIASSTSSPYNTFIQYLVCIKFHFSFLLEVHCHILRTRCTIDCNDWQVSISLSDQPIRALRPNIHIGAYIGPSKPADGLIERKAIGHYQMSASEYGPVRLDSALFTKCDTILVFFMSNIAPLIILMQWSLEISLLQLCYKLM